jgi:hypothetical protein
VIVSVILGVTLIAFLAITYLTRRSTKEAQLLRIQEERGLEALLRSPTNGASKGMAANFVLKPWGTWRPIVVVDPRSRRDSASVYDVAGAIDDERAGYDFYAVDPMDNNNNNNNTNNNNNNNYYGGVGESVVDGNDTLVSGLMSRRRSVSNLMGGMYEDADHDSSARGSAHHSYDDYGYTQLQAFPEFPQTPPQVPASMVSHFSKAEPLERSALTTIERQKEKRSQRRSIYSEISNGSGGAGDGGTRGRYQEPVSWQAQHYSLSPMVKSQSTPIKRNSVVSFSSSENRKSLPWPAPPPPSSSTDPHSNGNNMFANASLIENHVATTERGGTNTPQPLTVNTSVKHSAAANAQYMMGPLRRSLVPDAASPARGNTAVRRSTMMNATTATTTTHTTTTTATSRSTNAVRSSLLSTELKRESTNSSVYGDTGREGADEGYAMVDLEAEDIVNRIKEKFEMDGSKGY